MSPDPASDEERRFRGPVLAALFVALATSVAGAAPSDRPATFNEVADRSFVMQVFDRLGGTALALLIAAGVVVALLVWRVVVMVRRERPAPVPPKRRSPGAEGDATIERPTITATTDWGYDQNKRAALARSPVAMPNSDVDLPSLEHAVTQWTMSDVVKGGSVVAPPADALGQMSGRIASPYRTTFNPYFRTEERVHGVEVVEVADALLQAELLVQLGDPKQAMTLLSRHIRETEKPGPAVWLMLLGLYQSTGREAQYNALCAGFRTLFNAEVPPWASSPDAMARDLESYVQVIGKVQATWSGPQARATVDAMLNDDRGGSRQGFSLVAYRELLFLSEILATLDAIAQEEAERLGIGRKLGMLPA